MSELSEKQSELLKLLKCAFDKEALKKIVFSKPTGEVLRASGRLCAHRGRKILALEFSLRGNTVSQKNIPSERLEDEFSRLSGDFKQVNLISTLGDAEWKISSSGKESLLGADKLMRRLLGNAPAFESAISALDNKKNYILNGDEDFLIKLGVSSNDGRVHDKRQGKFRQINRFLEHIEDIYPKLPDSKELLIYDLCCGKSYLSFAVYYYLTEIKHRSVSMLGIDLKEDVIEWCEGLARELGYTGLRFITDDIKATPKDKAPDMVISLHACDIATDIVIDTAVELGAKIILSTPCCHRYLNGRVTARELSFITEFPHLSNKLCEAITDALRLQRLRAAGYAVRALELTDPDDTPKNTLLRAIKEKGLNDAELARRKSDYSSYLKFILGENQERYLKDF